MTPSRHARPLPESLGAALDDGELVRARRLADRLAAASVLSESSPVRDTAALWQVGVLAVAGDLERARTVLSQVATAAPDAAGEVRELGTALLLLYGRTPGALDRPWSEAPVRASPLTDALLADLRGDRATAQRLAGQALSHPARIAEQGLWELTRLAHLAFRLGDRSAARRIDRLLASADATGRAMLSRSGRGGDLPVAAHRARLALLVGEHESAAVLARTALAVARSLPSPPLEAWAFMTLSLALRGTGTYAGAAQARDHAMDAADKVGLLLPPDLPVGEKRPARMVRAGRVWVIGSPLGSGAVPALVGMGQLATLLAAGEPVSARELAGDGPFGTLRVAYARLDLSPEERRDCRHRLGVLESAGAADDVGARVELSLLERRIRRATGLESDEPPGSVLIPHSVGHNLRRAISAITSVAPDLGHHLSHSVLARAWCFYRPAPNTALRWTIERQGARPAQRVRLDGSARPNVAVMGSFGEG